MTLVIKRQVTILLRLFLAFSLSAFVPGSKTRFFNGATGPVYIRCETTTKSYPKRMGLWPGSGLILSGDYGDLVSLTIDRANGKPTHLTSEDIKALKTDVSTGRGAWLITDSAVRFVPSRTVNILEREMRHAR